MAIKSREYKQGFRDGVRSVKGFDKTLMGSMTGEALASFLKVALHYKDVNEIDNPYLILRSSFGRVFENQWLEDNEFLRTEYLHRVPISNEPLIYKVFLTDKGKQLWKEMLKHSFVSNYQPNSINPFN